ncbi:MAG TPA: hypothetical protein VH353_04645 [Caulobacteraceae bacterium]|jgi:hypothetical protein|nr:hypothetical protein [Caulobacteraceae bacterium]
MTRFARVIVPEIPHHLTNRREPIFLEDGDQGVYCDILAEQLRKTSRGLGLLPDTQPLHLILTPLLRRGVHHRPSHG